MLRHGRQHHRVTHRRWQARRRRLLRILWPRHGRQLHKVDTHIPSGLLGTKRQEDRRIEERRFRQQTRRALAHEDPLPRYRHDWAD